MDAAMLVRLRRGEDLPLRDRPDSRRGPRAGADGGRQSEDRRRRRRARGDRRGRRRRAPRTRPRDAPARRAADAERDDWAWASEAAARDVAEGRAEQAVVCCWTGTGASIAANKVPGVRAALCADAATAAGRAALERRERPRAQPALDLRGRARARSSTPGSPPSRADEAGDRANVGTWRTSSDPPPPSGRRRDHDRRAGGIARLRLDGASRSVRTWSTNFALTLDGSATIAGRSGPIGTDSDTAMLVALRTRVDAVMIGAGTMRAERYGRVMGDPAKRERREAEGFSPQTADGDRLGPARPAVGRAALHRGPRRGADLHRPPTWSRRGPRPPVHIVRHERAIDLPARMSAPANRRRASRRSSARAVRACTRSCIEARLVDELFVTHAPKLAGGTGPGHRGRARGGGATARARLAARRGRVRRALRPLPALGG